MNGEKEKKELLRKRIRGLLSGYPLSLLKEKSRLIQSYLFSLPEYQKSSVVMFYLSMDREVHTYMMINRAFKEKKEVVVPLVLKSQNIMLPCKIGDLNNLEPGPWGILQPRKEKIHNVPVSSIDLVIVPGLAFDKNGNRVGRGKGFYDRFLKLVNPKTMKIALAFSVQIVGQVPTAGSDIAVDKIVTEDGVIECE